MSLFLVMFGNEVSISEALFISVFAMTVVFLVLLIISYLIDISAFFTNGKQKQVKVDNENVVVVNDLAVNDKPKDDSELVAIITAAISEYLGTSSENIRIKKIRRSSSNRRSWSH